MRSTVCRALADRFASDGDKDGADAALYAADRAHRHCQTEDAMLDAMEAAEAQYDAQKQPGASATSSLGHSTFIDSINGRHDCRNPASHAPRACREFMSLGSANFMTLE